MCTLYKWMMCVHLCLYRNTHRNASTDYLGRWSFWAIFTFLFASLHIQNHLQWVHTVMVVSVCDSLWQEVKLYIKDIAKPTDMFPKTGKMSFISVILLLPSPKSSSLTTLFFPSEMKICFISSRSQSSLQHFTN